MKRLTISLLAVVAIAIGGWQIYGEPPVQDKIEPLKPFMQRKLDHSKFILEGLATEDFDQIRKNAQALSLLSLESNWNVLNTQEYLQQSSDFRRSVRVITDAAKEENLDRAALGFVDLTVRCVECHNYLRRGAPDE